MNYQEQLLTENWKVKRNIIFKRDNYCCQKCLSKKNLCVHHKKYINGRMCWDYPDSLLITLCKICHNKLHEETKVDVDKDKRSKTKKLTKKQKRYKKLYPNMFNFYNDAKNK
jgi:5-methylcytosine-specific restriction endonuclease McrA